MKFLKSLVYFSRSTFVLALAFTLTACSRIYYQPVQEPGVVVVENGSNSSFSVASEGFGDNVSFYTDANGERVRVTKPIPVAPMYTITTQNSGRETQFNLRLFSRHHENTKEHVRYRVRCHTARLILSKSNELEPVHVEAPSAKIWTAHGEFLTGVCNGRSVEIDGPEAIDGVSMLFKAQGSIKEFIKLQLPDLETQGGKVIPGQAVKLQAIRVNEPFSIR